MEAPQADNEHGLPGPEERPGALTPELVPELAPVPIRSWARLAGLWAVEAVAAVGAATALVTWSTQIVLNPFPRAAQVSALAALQLQFWGVGAVALVLALAGLRWRHGRVGALTERLACAITAGLASSLVAGAVVVGLNGTPWGLGSNNYDSANLASWAQLVSQGRPIPSAVYPPGFIYLLSWASELTGQSTFYCLKNLQIIGVAALGPLVYLAWRLTLRPAWALCLGTVAVLPFVDGYKPASALSLALTVPIVVALLQLVRRAPRYRWPALAGLGAGLGIALGAVVLLHPVYVFWSAPGVLVAIGLLIPWRQAWWRAGVLLGAALLGFGAVCGSYVLQFINAAGSTTENFVYFDALQDPAYFLMWRGGTPDTTGDWPPRGELGGVGLFAIVLVIAIGVAITIGYRRSLVVTLLCCFGSVWVWRLYDAATMYDQQQVRLWPRTSSALMYFALLLTGAAVLGTVKMLRSRPSNGAPSLPRLDHRGAILGCVVAALLTFGWAGSATADRYLPRTPGHSGYLTYLGQVTPMLDGHCSRWTRSVVTNKGVATCVPQDTGG